MAKRQRLLGNDTYFTVYNSDLKLIKDPVKKILFSKIKNWIYRNEDKNSKTHFQQGHWWTFGPYEYWADECGLEVKTVGKHLRELVKSGILKTGKFNKKGYDKTNWYRLANADEMEKVDFRSLFYGISKKKNSNGYDNNKLLRMYQNSMIDVKRRGVGEEDLGLPIPEHISEHISDHTLDDTSELILKDTNGNKRIIEDYLKINSNDIIIHVEHLMKLNELDISTDLVKLFLNKFHEKKIDLVKDQNQLFEYSYRIDGMYETVLNQSQLNFCKSLAKKYFENIISPQPAEPHGEDVTVTSKITISKPSSIEDDFLQNAG